MRKQDYLVQLIHAMTPNEKKHFRQYIAAGDNSKGYQKLFDVLQKSESYDAAALSIELQKSKKNIADDKEYLQEILLRSLTGFHAQSMYRARVYNGLLEAEILAAKGLMKFSLAHLRKLKKGMISGEENILYYQALAQEVSLVRAITPGGLKADEWVKAKGEELISRLEAGALNNRLVSICIRIQDLSADIRYIENKAVQKEARELMKEATRLVKGKKVPSAINQTYHHLMSQYYFFMGVDSRLSVMHAKKDKESYEAESEEYKQFFIQNYFLHYSDMLQAYFELREYKEVEHCIEKIREYASQKISKQLRIKAERRVFHFSVLLHTATGDHEQALRYIQTHLDDYRKLTSVDEDLALVRLLRAINLFHLQRYNEALDELLPLLSKDAPAQLPETTISARALNLMIQYELGNRLSMPSYIRAAQRFFTNEGLMTKEVKLFLELMRYLTKHDKKVPIESFQKSFKEVYDGHRFELIGYFVIWPWLQRFPKRKA